MNKLYWKLPNGVYVTTSDSEAEIKILESLVEHKTNTLLNPTELLDGIIRCKRCDKPMETVITNKQCPDRLSYRCRSWQSCSNYMVNAKYLDNYLVKVIRKLLETDISKIARNLISSEVEKLTNDVANAVVELNICKDKIYKALNNAPDDTFILIDSNNDISELSNRKLLLERRIGTYKGLLNELSNLKTINVEPYKTYLNELIQVSDNKELHNHIYKLIPTISMDGDVIEIAINYSIFYVERLKTNLIEPIYINRKNVMKLNKHKELLSDFRVKK